MQFGQTPVKGDMQLGCLNLCSSGAPNSLGNCGVTRQITQVNYNVISDIVDYD